MTRGSEFSGFFLACAAGSAFLLCVVALATGFSDELAPAALASFAGLAVAMTSADPGVAVKMESFDALTEIPAVSLANYSAVANAGNLLAYKFISAEPKSAPEWKLSVATEAVAA